VTYIHIYVTVFQNNRSMNPFRKLKHDGLELFFTWKLEAIPKFAQSWVYNECWAVRVMLTWHKYTSTTTLMIKVLK